MAPAQNCQLKCQIVSAINSGTVIAILAPQAVPCYDALRRQYGNYSAAVAECVRTANAAKSVCIINCLRRKIVYRNAPSAHFL